MSHRAGRFEAELRQVAEWILEICRKCRFLVAGVQGGFTDGGRRLEITYESWGDNYFKKKQTCFGSFPVKSRCMCKCSVN